jgi:23S rRNA G2445 N2-methylase RlmL
MNKEKLLSYLTRCFENSESPRLKADVIPVTVEFLKSEDLKFRRYIGDLLISNSPLAVPALFRASRISEPEIRRSVIFLIGRVFPTLVSKHRETAESILVRALSDSDPKVRKNSAVALGKLHLTAREQALIDALSRETISWVRTSVILAMGALGSGVSMDYLTRFVPENDNERLALEKAIDTLSPSSSRFEFNVNSQFDTAELWTHKGLESILIDQLNDKHHPSKVIGPGRVTVNHPDFRTLKSLRTWREVLFPVSTGCVKFSTDSVSDIYSTFRDAGLLDVLERSHEGDIEQIPYRIEIRGNDLGKDIRRELIDMIRSVLRRYSSKFHNSISHYEIELRVMVKVNKEMEFFWKPSSYAEDRFLYRTSDVPASIHPVLAAGIMQCLDKRIDPGHRVVDPFCGSGTLLLERAFKSKYMHMTGFDRSTRAIKAFRENLGNCDFNRISIRKRNFESTEFRNQYDELISNLPFGGRSGSHKTNIDLYHTVFKRLRNIVKPGGFVALLSQEISLMEELFRLHKDITLDRCVRFDAGGLTPGLFIGTMNH